MGVVEFLLIGFVVLFVVTTILATFAAFVLWRVIAPDSRFFSLSITLRGIRVHTDRGEIIPGAVRYTTFEEQAKRKRHRLALGDDGELVDLPLDAENGAQSASRG